MLQNNIPRLYYSGPVLMAARFPLNKETADIYWATTQHELSCDSAVGIGPDRLDN
jgi:hypothetical protein